MAEPDLKMQLRKLPSVDELLRAKPLTELAGRAGRGLVLRAAREELEARRARVLAGDGHVAALDELARAAAERVIDAMRPSLRQVVNATGVVVHTNLGRAPLPDAAIAAVESAGHGYTNLELDIGEGRRGSRQRHVAGLLCELTGAEAALTVNNNAAAVLLALATLARGREVVISRGQLVEIGGSFRIPDICAQSGARLVEVGTTNRTRLADYERAIGPDTAALVRIHPSNFRTLGFTEEVEIEGLCELAQAHDLRVVDDLGSGALADVEVFGDEPSVGRSLEAGADVICFSGDKLLGGPQAGILLGKRETVKRCAGDPLARALRPDKLTLAALEATLKLYRDPDRALAEIPVLRMLVRTGEELEKQAARMCDLIDSSSDGGCNAEVIRAKGRVGGGALPLVELEGSVCAVKPKDISVSELGARLRRAPTPVICRLSGDRLLLDPRTMSEGDMEVAALAVAESVR